MSDNQVIAFLKWINNLRRQVMQDDSWRYLLPEGNYFKKTDWLTEKQALKYWQQNVYKK